MRTLGLLCILSVMIIWLIVYFRYVAPARKIKLGIELLTGQETNNRLKETGNIYADKVVRLFNTLMERLHSQIVRNEEQHSLLSALIAVSPQGIIMMDYDDRISSINPSALNFLKTENEFAVGKQLGELHNALADKLVDVRNEATIIRLSESEIYVCRRLSFIDRGFSRPVILIDNMTEEIHEAEKETFSRLIRITAHEVNNTLGGIKSILSTIEDFETESDIIKEVLESGKESCDRLSDFVNSYAEVARLPKPDMKPVSLKKLLADKYPFLQSMAMNRAEVLLKFDSEDGMSASLGSGNNGEVTQEVNILADSAQIERVIVNVVLNAIEAMPAGRKGKMYLECNKNDVHNPREMQLIISNDGNPITISDTSSLFRYSVSDKPGGRGTGLALVAEILNNHKWRYTLSTDADNLTRFRMYVPLISG